MQMSQLYNWSDPNEKVDTQWGIITVREWLDKEANRINSDPKRRAEVLKKAGKLALFVDKVAKTSKVKNRWGTFYR